MLTKSWSFTPTMRLTAHFLYIIKKHGQLFIHNSVYSNSGVRSNRALRGPQIQVVGVVLIIEFCDHNIPFLKVVF